ncbi:MAG TPA: histidine kinase [Candidatus Eisenbergiella merdipullorum]|uniref:Histidine kinase n=1 Tax=Candidatus Eisenbergiella merdipullorum TaxID=2838553 RepID=A0A9D2I7U6_9FIRM|nr:histidine kinase [Candidatus Eisenbergiella merdipullorum]
MAMAYTKTDNTFTKAIDMLSTMMRYMKGVDYNVVTIQKELEYSKAYIGLEQLRFGNKLKVSWEVPVELEEYEIVKVTLQPILENCIRHGFKNMKSEEVRPLIGQKIGIRNVDERIRMIFGTEYGLHIEETETGFCVAIRIPAIREEMGVNL